MHFLFTRSETKNKLDEKGQPVFILDENGEPTKDVEKITTSLEDSFNVSRVIRTHRLNATTAVILLDDGHEVTEKVPVLKNPNKKGPITQADVTQAKERVWVQSEITLSGDDCDRWYNYLRSTQVQ